MKYEDVSEDSLKKTGQFYTVSEKRLANLHIISEKWPYMASNFSQKSQSLPS